MDLFLLLWFFCCVIAGIFEVLPVLPSPTHSWISIALLLFNTENSIETTVSLSTLPYYYCNFILDYIIPAKETKIWEVKLCVWVPTLTCYCIFKIDPILDFFIGSLFWRFNI
jgi:hypothetical protein